MLYLAGAAWFLCRVVHAMAVRCGAEGLPEPPAPLGTRFLDDYRPLMARDEAKEVRAVKALGPLAALLRRR